MDDYIANVIEKKAAVSIFTIQEDARGKTCNGNQDRDTTEENVSDVKTPWGESNKLNIQVFQGHERFNQASNLQLKTLLNVFFSPLPAAKSFESVRNVRTEHFFFFQPRTSQLKINLDETFHFSHVWRWKGKKKEKSLHSKAGREFEMMLKNEEGAVSAPLHNDWRKRREMRFKERRSKASQEWGDATQKRFEGHCLVMNDSELSGCLRKISKVNDVFCLVLIQVGW